MGRAKLPLSLTPSHYHLASARCPRVQRPIQRFQPLFYPFFGRPFQVALVHFGPFWSVFLLPCGGIGGWGRYRNAPECTGRNGPPVSEPASLSVDSACRAIASERRLVCSCKNISACARPFPPSTINSPSINQFVHPVQNHSLGVFVSLWLIRISHFRTSAFSFRRSLI